MNASDDHGFFKLRKAGSENRSIDIVTFHELAERARFIVQNAP